MARKKKKQRSSRPVRSGPSRRLVDLRVIDDLLQQERWQEAIPLLQAQDLRHPRQPEILFRLAEAYHGVGDLFNHLNVIERLHVLDPNDADVSVLLGGAYLAVGNPARALRVFHRFLQRWPDHPQAAETRRRVEEIEPTLDEELAKSGLVGPEGREMAAQNEEMVSLLEQGKFFQARQVGEQLLRRAPNKNPILNNISETWFREGNFDQAIANGQRVLADQPDSYHALANLARYQFLSGRADEARQTAARLKAVTSSDPDIWSKKAETFTYLGDDQAVLDALRGAEEAGQETEAQLSGLLYHLAAVAAFRQGREDEARRHWQRSLRLMPGLQLAQANLDDLDLPVGQQNAPWAFPLPYWIPERTFRELANHLEKVVRHTRDEAATVFVQRFLEGHPEMRTLVPALLDRGDGAGRAFAVQLGELSQNPEVVAALRDFALGQRGPDDLRLDAALVAARAGLLPSGEMVRMWREGQWTDSLLLGFEISGEPAVPHRPAVRRLAEQAGEAGQEGDHVRAEQLYRQAAEMEPDAPDLLNNLAASIQQQGRQEEAYELIRQIHARFPDYLFARTGIAQMRALEGDTAGARELLRPLLNRARFHHSEFAALCMAEVELGLAEGNRDTARAWLAMWERIYPDHPLLPTFAQRVRQPRIRDRLAGWRSWFGGKRDPG